MYAMHDIDFPLSKSGIRDVHYMVKLRRIEIMLHYKTKPSDLKYKKLTFKLSILSSELISCCIILSLDLNIKYFSIIKY